MGPHAEPSDHGRVTALLGELCNGYGAAADALFSLIYDELRFFGGLNLEEVAEVLGVSKRTVEGEWTHAKAWLRLELSRE